MRRLNFFWIFFCICYGQKIADHPDTRLSTESLIRKYGYPVETHEVTTEDGYTLTMYRIPHGRQSSGGVNRKPILVMHGLFGQSENYIVSGMNNGSLAYTLADKGYDVWLGNTRGTQHGQRHQTLKPTQKEFWDFSFHEIGIYDIPAKVDHILMVSKKKKIFYIGHSQGGTGFYVMCSERPEYQDKIIMASLLAPAGFMGHFSNPLLLPLFKPHKEWQKLLSRIDIFALPPPGLPILQFFNQICHIGILHDLCLSVYHILLNGGDSGEFDKKMLPLIMRFVPSIAIKQLIHFAQEIESGRFRKWDYGFQENSKKYGSIDPPDYALQNITVPIAIYYSKADNLVYTRDIEDTCKVLPNCVRKFLITNPKWTHLDFIFALNGDRMLFQPLLSFLNKYDKT